MLASMMADIGHFFATRIFKHLMSMRKSKGIPAIQRSRGLLLNH
jgi:hypothetical protein